MAGESSRKQPRISHVSNSTNGSDFGSSSDFANYIVTVPETPDNNPAQVQIALRDIDSKDDDSDQTDPRISVEEEDVTLLHKLSNPFDSGSSYKDDESVQTDPRINGEEEDKVTLLHKISKPLTRVVKISPIIIALYRILIVVRIVSLGLFLLWRIRHPNEKAIWLWLLSVICEMWFAFSWLIDQIPKLFPVNHATDIEALKTKFETPNQSIPMGKSDLPGVDVFVSTTDVEKEPTLVTANTILSILSADYPVEMLSCYISDEEGSLLTFEAMAETASFAKMWVPFCRKYKIEPRNPETYFGLKRDPNKDKVREQEYVLRGYEQFKVRVNSLSHSIRQRSEAFNSKEEIKALQKLRNWKVMDKEDQVKVQRSSKATWMRDGTLWPGSWIVPCPHHSRGDHASIIQMLLNQPGGEPVKGRGGDGNELDFQGVDIRLPMLVYVSLEKQPAYDHNKKPEAINELVQASAKMSNGPFILNLNCDHYVYKSRALRDGICSMMDPDGDRVSFVQFSQRFEGIDPSDRCANNNTVFFDINLKALDGMQGPMYVGTGRLFRRTALYGTSDLPSIDVFVSTADAEKEPPLVTANTILSILSVDYPVEKLSCYISDDGGSLLTFEAMAEAASFAKTWVPFCRKHKIEPRNPESYFSLKRDPYKDKVRHDFVRERRYVKRGYEEYKVRVNALSHSIRRRSDAFNSKEEIKALEKWKNWKVMNEEDQIKQPRPNIVAPKATWMSDGTLWPGTWTVPCLHHSRGDHASIIQVLLDPPGSAKVRGRGGDGYTLDFEGVDIHLPMLVYMSREKRPGYDHNKKAGAMNALVRASAIMSNGPFILNLDCDHYVYNSRALRDGICFMMDRDGDRVSFVQFPQRFEGIDPSDRYANHNTVFFDINLRALDGVQGPMYVGTGCLFRRTALYGFNPPDVVYAVEETSNCCGCCFPRIKKRRPATVASEPEYYSEDEYEDQIDFSLIPKQFGSSSILVSSVKVAEFQGRPLATECSSGGRGRTPGSLTARREPLDFTTVSEAVNVISCWYEDKTEWGTNVGWIYGSVTEDVVTGFRMHEKGWRSFYCVSEPDAFRGTAPINLTDRLHQVLRWATGSVEIFFSRNNAILAGSKLKLLQRIAYLNVGIYPFTSIFILTYCFLPPLSLFSGQFVVDGPNPSFLAYLLVISLSLCGLAVLEVKWSGISLEEWWRNEQFWLIGGTSAHLVAVLQGILKVIAGIEISFTLTSKSSGDDEDDEFADLYLFKWTSLMIPPLTIIILNIVGILFAVCRTIFREKPNWSNLIGGTFFAIWVLAHMYPFAKGLMGRRGRTPTIVYVWSGLIAICFSLLYITIKNSEIDGGSFQLT